MNECTYIYKKRERIDLVRKNTNSGGITVKIQYIEIDLNHKVQQEAL